MRESYQGSRFSHQIQAAFTVWIQGGFQFADAYYGS
jgi:hypothetical protein